MSRPHQIEIAMIWAGTPSGLIGRDDWMPWRLPDDLRHFKALTLEGCVLMGHRTFQSLKAPLPQRDNLVMRRPGKEHIPGVRVVHSLHESIDAAQALGHTRLWVCGGAQIYRLALPLAQRLEQTLVHDDQPLREDDTVFEFDPSRNWRLQDASFHPQDERHSHAFSFLSYRKIS